MSTLDIDNACSTSRNEPLGTTSLAAASCNLSYLDRVSNSSNNTETNRLGVATDTVRGAINKLGVIYDDPIRDWVSGIVTSDVRATRYPAITGDIYIPIAPLPFTSGLTFNTDDWILAREYQESLVEAQLINDLSQAYEVTTVTALLSDAIVYPSGKVLHLKDRGADFIFAIGGTANGTSILDAGNGNTAVLDVQGTPACEQFGSLGDGSDDTAAIVDALSVNGKASLVNTGTPYQINSNVSGLFGYADITFTGTGTVGYTNVLKEPLYQPGSRNAIHYNSAQEIYINSGDAVMGGFRFRGQYLEGVSRSFPAPAFRNVVSLINDLGAESVKAAETWYGVFAVANEGDTECQFKLMPFLRLGAPTGDVYPLVEAGENSFAATAGKTHTWDTGIVGVECLTCTRTLALAGAGRKVTVLAATNTSVTLEASTQLIQGDFILPQPKGFEFYRYCGSFYNDTAEVRNIADTGFRVGSRGASLTQLQADGYDAGVATDAQMEPLGNISPLASGIILVSQATFSTPSVGTFNEEFSTDGGQHEVAQSINRKVTTDTDVIDNTYQIPFSLQPFYFYTTTGSIDELRTGGRHLGRGYFES